MQHIGFAWQLLNNQLIPSTASLTTSALGTWVLLQSNLMSIYYLRLRCYLKPSQCWLSQRYILQEEWIREPIMVRCPEPTLQQFFLKMSSSKVFLCTSASQGSSSSCVSTVAPWCTHTTYPVLPTSIYLHLAVVKHRTLHLPPLQQQQLRENIAALPLCKVRDTWRGWIYCMYKSQSSASSFATRSLRNADSRQAKNRPEGTPLETHAHTALLITVCWYLYSLIAVYFIKKM